MAKQLIINAIEPREVRAAILENGDPSHFFVERSKRKFQKGNIYRARVTSIEPHLQAAFVELEKGQHGFLGLSDIILPDAGVSLINGQPAPPMPGSDKEKDKENEIKKEEGEAESESESEAGSVLLDENTSVPSKTEEKPQAIELSPVAGDMLLGLETDLNSPIQNVEEEESEEKNEEKVEEETKAVAETEVQPETAQQNEPEAETSAEAVDEAKEEEPELKAEAEEKQDEAPSTENAETADENKTPEESETFLEGDDVDTTIFSMDDEPEQEEAPTETETASSENDDEGETKAGETLLENNTEGEEEPKPANEQKARFRPRNRGRNKPNYNNNRRRRPNMKIEEVLEVGQFITVQIIKEGIGNKAPMVSTFLSLAGHYMVLTPGGDRSGVSKQVRVQAERTRLKKFIDDNKIPDRCGLIVRTAAEGISEKDLKSDIDNLTQTWEDLQTSFKKLNRPGVIKQEEALASRLVRDYYSQDIDEVWIDDKSTFDEIKAIFEKGMSEQVDRLHFFEENSSIFYHYKVEAAIKGLFNRKVTLPGGGSLVFDQNEAMLVIDINSGTFKEGEDDEDTAFKLNMLACKEIARQVQMRDVGGIVMIDFVDMRRLSNRSKVEKELEKSFKGDKARINIMHIGALGVLQMSRQRTKDSLRANLYSNCPHCDGTGLIPSKIHSSMSILREIRSNIKRFKGACLKVKTTSEMALELLNNYKAELSSLEESEGAQIQIDIDPKLKVGEFNIDNKNAPKRANDPSKSQESNNKKKRRKRNNKKKEDDASQAEATNNGNAANEETMTNRLQRMEKEFPSDNLGIIKAPKPENDASIKNEEAKKGPEETKETAPKAEAETPKNQGVSEEKEPKAEVKEAEVKEEKEDKPARKPRAKKAVKSTTRKKPAPKKDEAESSGGAPEKGDQDSGTSKPKPKAKAKTASKKKAATKKTSVKKTATKSKKIAASKTKSSDSAKTEE